MDLRIGENLTQLRRAAGMSQDALADASGVSLSLIRALEQGRRDGAQLKSLSALAAALGTTTGALLGDASAAVAHREPDAEPAGLVGVRRALTPVTGLDGQPLDIDPAGPPPTVAGVATAVRTANGIYHRNAYADTLACLPELLGQARALVDHTDGDEQATAHAYAARAYTLTGRLLIQLRKADLAQIALGTAARHARASGDQVVGAEAIAPMCWLLIRVGRFAEALTLAMRTADAIEPPKMSTATPEQLASWGFLLTKAAAAAVRDARRSEAAEILMLADGVAHSLGDRRYPHAALAGNDFSVAGVHLMRTEAAVIAGQPDRALVLAEQAVRTDGVTPSGWQRHRLDAAWAYVQTRQYGEAVAVLRELRKTARPWLLQQQFARDIAGEMAAARQRAWSTDMAELHELFV